MNKLTSKDSITSLSEKVLNDISRQPLKKNKSSLYDKVTTSVAHFFHVAFENFIKIFEGGSPQDIMREKFQEWHEEDKKDEFDILNYKSNFHLGQRVIINNSEHIPFFRGVKDGHVAKIVALSVDINGKEVVGLFNPLWVCTREDLSMNYLNVDPKKCQLEVVGVKSDDCEVLNV